MALDKAKTHFYQIDETIVTLVQQFEACAFICAPRNCSGKQANSQTFT
ncbi:hypothetical protein ACF3DV_26400 [Chlorogloeopsis fritschii PCC 9212]|nr:hypothetical protein [Chlorogloeopsis fritschii]